MHGKEDGMPTGERGMTIIGMPTYERSAKTSVQLVRQQKAEAAIELSDAAFADVKREMIAQDELVGTPSYLCSTRMNVVGEIVNDHVRRRDGRHLSRPRLDGKKEMPAERVQSR
jgi:hypothetical protein